MVVMLFLSNRLCCNCNCGCQGLFLTREHIYIYGSCGSCGGGGGGGDSDSCGGCAGLIWGELFRIC